MCCDKSILVHLQAKHLHGKSLTINSILEENRSAIREQQLTMNPWGLTQRVDHADSTHVQLQEGVVDWLPSLVVHEQVVDHRAQLGWQAGQEVHHTQPCHADLRPGDVKRQQHQEANQRDAWRVSRQRNRESSGYKRRLYLYHTIKDL